MTRRQPREKLVYLCENLMSNNFLKTAVVKKIWILNYSFITYDSTEKIYMKLHALEPLFKIFCTFVCENVSSCRLKFPGKIADKYMENLKQAPADI